MFGGFSGFPLSIFDANFIGGGGSDVIQKEGIEEWVKNLLPVGGAADHEGNILIKLQDNNTGATYLIRRIG